MTVTMSIDWEVNDGKNDDDGKDDDDGGGGGWGGGGGSCWLNKVRILVITI